MKNRLLLILSILIFCCLNAVGQKNNKYIKDSDLQPIHDAIANLQDSLQYYQEQNLLLVKQMNDSKKEVISISEDYLIKYEDLKYSINLWLVFVSIIMTVIGGFLGVGAPIYFNYRNEKNVEKMLKESKEEASKATKQAEDARTELSSMQTTVSNASIQAVQATNQAQNARTVLINFQSKADVIAKNAENAANNAQAIQFFIQASQESEPAIAINLYSKCVTLDKDFAEAYNYRGYLKYRNGIDGAMDDFDKAIYYKSNNYPEAFNNRGLMKFEKGDLDGAMDDFDKAIKGKFYEAYLNRGLLKYAKNDDNDDDNDDEDSNNSSKVDGAEEDFDRAIYSMTNKADAYYIMGLYKYSLGEIGAKEIGKAKEYKPNVIEVYPNRNLLSDEMKILDNSFNDVEYSKDMTILVRVPDVKNGYFRIPNGIIKIGNYAFCGCKNITSIEIPNGVTEIGEGAFLDCTSLTSIIIPPSVTIIGERAFMGCSSLSSIIIPESVTIIGENAFMGCTNLKSIEIPEEVTEIKAGAFLGCSSLTSIIIPESVTIIGENAFSGDTSIIGFGVDNKNLNYCTVGGVLYSRDKVTLVRVPSDRDTFIIPDSVTKIGEGAFSSCTNLTSIEIPDSVTEIGGGAFFGCTSLASIKIPDSVTKIGESAFNGCASLKSVEIPNGMSEIMDWTFFECTGLESITIPSSITKICIQSFYGCSNITTLHLRHIEPLDFSSAFVNIDISNITLFVPKGSRDNYLNHKLYGQFKKIIDEE